jgi:hypothetical protein
MNIEEFLESIQDLSEHDKEVTIQGVLRDPETRPEDVGRLVWRSVYNIPLLKILLRLKVSMYAVQYTERQIIRHTQSPIIESLNLPEAFKLIVDAGFDVNHDIRDDNIYHQLTNLTNAIQYPEVLEYCLENTRLANLVDNIASFHFPRDTPLASIRLLLKHGWDIDAFRTYQKGLKMTPLMRAAETFDAPLVDVLIQCGAKVNAVDDHGRSALWYAVLHENPLYQHDQTMLGISEPLRINTVKCLLEHGALIVRPELRVNILETLKRRLQEEERRRVSEDESFTHEYYLTWKRQLLEILRKAANERKFNNVHFSKLFSDPPVEETNSKKVKVNQDEERRESQERPARLRLPLDDVKQIREFLGPRDKNAYLAHLSDRLDHIERFLRHRA